MRLILMVIPAVLVGLACGTKYSKEVQKTIRDAYGDDFRNYTFRASPVGTFGVGTMYLKELADKGDMPIDDRYLIAHPSSWFGSGVSEADARALNATIIVPGDLGSATISRNVSTKLGLGVVVPAIQQVVSGGLDLNYRRGVKVKLTATKANHHKLHLDRFIAAMSDNKIAQSVKNHWQARDFLLTAADITLTGYKATVTIDESVNPSLHAKFNELVGTTSEAGTVKINVARSADGTFEVAAQEDVVAALLVKEPPATAQLATMELESWPTVVVDQRLLAVVDSIAAVTAD